MSDLDAVNISNRIITCKDAIRAISEYYTEMENGQTNGAREFKCNIGEVDPKIGLYILFKEAEDYY